MALSPKERAYQKNYWHTEKGRAVKTRYMQSEKGKASRKRANEKYRQTHREERRTRERSYRAKHPERVLDIVLRTKFNITVDQYNELLVRQMWTCAICERPCKTNRRLAVDHDHNS